MAFVTLVPGNWFDAATRAAAIELADVTEQLPTRSSVS